jgi:UDP-N-acetylmuramate--alanine ligase
MLKHRIKRVHFVGIGGSGMCGIAEVLLTLGYQVSGSDVKAGEAIDRLKARGAVVAVGHAAANVGGAQVVVYSSAVPPENPEVAEARRRGIPIIRRAEMLAELMRLKYGVAVAGTHGKTTTTCMAGLVLSEAGLDPTVVIGGRLNSVGGNALAGAGEYLVAEADESDASFLCLAPILAVITNVDDDHLDHYRSIDRLQAAFVEFAQRVPFYGAVVACLDDAGVRQVVPRITRRVVTYGLGPGAMLEGRDAKLSGEGSLCRVRMEGRDLGELRLKVPGRHVLLNALAAVGAGLELDIPFATAARALAGYDGVARRLQFKGEARGVRVYDDYGHHPTEIRATLGAARLLAGKGRLIVLFQPHRFTRTNLLRDAFAGAFESADEAVITDIYPAGEQPIPGVDGSLVAGAVERHGRPAVRFIPDLATAASAAAAAAGPGDLVVTLGAGDVSRQADRILDLLGGGAK